MIYLYDVLLQAVPSPKGNILTEAPLAVPVTSSALEHSPTGFTVRVLCCLVHRVDAVSSPITANALFKNTCKCVQKANTINDVECSFLYLPFFLF